MPADRRGEKAPSRHIPLTSHGDTLLQMYRGGTEQEIEEALSVWLENEITKLERAEKTGTRVEQPNSKTAKRSAALWSNVYQIGKGGSPWS